MGSFGRTFTTTVNYTQAAIAPKSPSETADQYLARLRQVDGQSLQAQATLNWRDAAGNNYGDIQARAFTSTVRLPVLIITNGTLPATALPGQELTLNVTVSNTGGCTAAPATVTVTNPDGTTSAQPGFPLAAGQSNTVTVKWRVPLATARDDEETEAQYLARLQATSLKQLSFSSSLSWTDPSGASSFGPTQATSSIVRETLPILTLAVTAPATAPAGTTVNYGVAVANTGSGASGAATVSLTLPSLVVQTIAVPALAPGAVFNATAPYAIPGTQAAGAMNAAGSLMWTDPAGNAFGPFTSGAAIAVTNPVAYNSLVLGPISSGPNVAGTAQTVTVTVKNQAGVPVANTTVTFTITGVNPTTGTATTDANGVATFSYNGANPGVDTVTVTATDAGGVTSVSNAVPVNWVVPVQSISTTTIYGRFFPNPDPNNGSFNTPGTATPAFAQTFPNINFGDGAPFRNSITDVSGNVIGTMIAAGGGYIAGKDALQHFQAVFTGQFNVTSAGNAVLDFFNDDGFILGIGPNAAGQQPTRVSGAMDTAPASGRTAFENFPVMGAVNRPSAGGFAVPITVSFPAPGAYPFEIDYAECCPSRMILRMNLREGPVAKPVAPTGGIAITPGTFVGNTGASTTLTLTARNAAGTAVPNLPVRVTIAGANPRELTVTTGANGTIALPVTGTVSGMDYVQGIANIAGMAVFSNSAELRWGTNVNFLLDSPSQTPGFILAPQNLSEVRGPVNITYRPPFVFGSFGGPLEYWPVSNPADVRVINANALGTTPGSLLGVFDPSGLPNGEYVIQFRAGLNSRIQVRVVGENKPGRMRASVTDFTVPLAGIPITIGRTYDSLERTRSGDFGYGWDLSIGGPKLEVNSQSDVTFTVGGKRMTFFMTPQSSGFPFPFWLTPRYTAERGTYGSIAAVGGCPVVIQSASGRYLCFPETVTPYAPVSYVYTAPDGVKYEMNAADGKMISITDLSGNKLTFGANGITSTAGNVNVPFLRDGNGRVTRITDAAGNAYNYSYNAAGELVGVQYPTLPLGTVYEYAAGHFLTKETDPRGNSAQTTYTADGKLATVRTAAGELTSFGYAYDAAAQRTTTTQTNPDGGVETVTTDINGNVLERRDGLGRRTVLTYDANNNVLTETNHLGETKTYTYDARGFRTSVQDALGNRSTVTYNQYGGPVELRDQLAVAGLPGGNIRTVAYDAQFRPATITDALGQVAAVTYDAQGNVATLRDANGKQTSFTYDARGNKLSETDPLNRVRRWTYDAMGRVLTETDARLNVTTSVYDGLGRKTQVTDAEGGITRMEWDAEGNKTADVDARLKRTEYSYDGNNRLITTKFPDNSTVTATYDFRNNKVTETDQLLRVTRSEYDKAGQLTAVTKAFGTPVAGTMSYGYDGAGRKNAETDERGNATAWEYDAAGRMTKVTNAKGEATEYGYDGMGSGRA